jgi:uncharacterized protein (DUF305 family)
MRTGFTWVLVAMASLLTIGAAACGEDEATTESGRVAGNGVDRAFVAEMIPHHRSAVEMAEIAAQRSKRSEITELAEAIVSTQNAEIQQLQGFEQRLVEAGVEHGNLGMGAHEMGAGTDAPMLRDAKPFDREFIDAMIPHHQGAIRMARVELEQGENPDVKQLAEAIIAAQSKEIDQMNQWRVEWYGRLSPAGGVPEEAEHRGHEG